MKLTLKLYTTLLTSMLLTATAAAQVSSISSDNLVQYGKDQAYWESEVSCSDDSKRTIQRKTDGSEWCGKDIEGFCDATKESAATKICGTQYSSALALLETAKQAQNDAAQAEQRARQAEQQRARQDRLANERQLELERQQAAAAPLKKKISIEEELLKIEQEKLDLRRQELELQRRAVEIEALLEKAS